VEKWRLRKNQLLQKIEVEAIVLNSWLIIRCRLQKLTVLESVFIAFELLNLNNRDFRDCYLDKKNDVVFQSVNQSS